MSTYRSFKYVSVITIEISLFEICTGNCAYLFHPLLAYLIIDYINTNYYLREQLSLRQFIQESPVSIFNCYCSFIEIF